MTAAIQQSLHTSFHPRSELVTSHSSIDSALKALKSSSKQLQATLSTFHDEMRILERLYYKGKNQHRSALFWRRVCELRRFGERIKRTQMEVLVEQTRRSFWGPLDQQSTKTLKGSWTHFPDTKFVQVADTHLSLFSLLCNKSLERISDAFQHFTLCMQSGAFIQLLLTLCGISARARALIVQLVDIIDVCKKHYAVIIQVLKANFHPQENKLENADNCISHEIPDISQQMEHSPINATSVSSLQLPEVVFDMHANTTTINTEILFEPKISTPIDASHELNKEKESSSHKSKKNPKKRKKRDEIDEIFNF